MLYNIYFNPFRTKKGCKKNKKHRCQPPFNFKNFRQQFRMLQKNFTNYIQIIKAN